MVQRRSNTELGHIAEDAACLALEQRGYEILERNWRCEAGEIDIVALHGSELVFVEVKARRGEGFGTAEEGVTAVKRRRIVASAQMYIATNGLEAAACRVDVVAISLSRSGETKQIRVYQNAFYAED